VAAAVCQDDAVTAPRETTTAPALGARRPPPPKVRRWLVVATAVWIAVLVGAIVVANADFEVTDREQTTVAEARPYVDTAIARVAAAATHDGQAVVAISGFERSGPCDVTVFRGGQRYGRAITVIVPPGTESALLERIRDRLPADYQTIVRTGTAPRLVADAGFYVLLTGSVIRPGEVRLFADTGDCRVPGDVSTTDATGGDRAAVQEVLTQLGVPDAEFTESAVTCPEGGTTRTVTGTATDRHTGALDARLHAASPLVAGPRLYAYRTGDTGVAVRAHDASLLVTATTPCR
jgi:hypothetical protein